LSSVGWIIIAAIFGLLVITFFKIFPMYYDNFQVKAALEAMAADNTIDPKSKREIWTSLEKRLYIDSVKSIKRENVSMERKDGKTTVTVTYETRDNYVANLYIGASFVEKVVIER
jgi:hypothetical protein